MTTTNNGVLNTVVNQVKQTGDATLAKYTDAKAKYEKAAKTASDLKNISDGTATNAANAKKAMDDAKVAYDNARAAYDKQSPWTRNPSNMNNLGSIFSMKQNEYNMAARQASDMKAAYDNADKVASDLKAELDKFSSTTTGTTKTGFTTQEYASYDEKTFDDYMFQLFIGSVSVVGLFVLFRIIQKSK